MKYTVRTNKGTRETDYDYDNIQTAINKYYECLRLVDDLKLNEVALIRSDGVILRKHWRNLTDP